MAPEGLITIGSHFDLPATIERLERTILSSGMTVFARVDHGEGAKLAGLSLRPTVVLIFGNAKVGTPLMHDSRTIGIDLPLRLLVWEDESGNTRITYNDVDWLVNRHAVSENILPIAEKMKRALDEVLRSLTQS